MQIVDHAPQYTKGVRDLYSDYFGPFLTERFEERWKWQYEDNPWLEDRNSVIKLMLSDQEVVAHVAAFPLPMVMDGNRFIVLLGADFVIRESHRKLALPLLKLRAGWRPLVDTGFNPTLEKLFRLTGVHLVPLSRQQLYYPLAYHGAIQRAARRRLPKELRWLATETASRVVSRFVKPPGAIPRRAPPPDPGTTGLRRISVFDEAYDELWRSFRAEVDCSLDKDALYMNWRYVQGPGKSIESWAHHTNDGRLDGVVVFSPRIELDDDRNPCGLGGEILELIAPASTDASVVDHLVRFAVHRLSERGVDEVTALGLRTAYHEGLRRLGFEHRELPHYTVSLALEGVSAKEIDGKNWYLSAGDGDQHYWSLA